MDEKYTDVAKSFLGVRHPEGTQNLKKIQALNQSIAQHKEKALAAFARVQLCMANNITARDWPVADMRSYIKLLDDNIKAIEEMSIQVLVAMSPVEHTLGIGTGVTPAELEGARLRSGQTEADSE